MMECCNGNHCPVKNTCLRYTSRDAHNHIANKVKCTSQRKYIQDESKINKDSKKH